MNRGTVFIKSIDAINQIKDAEYLNQLLNEVIDKIGEDYTVQTVIDNAACMKKVGRILMEKRDHICYSPCTDHCLDLIIEDIAKKDKVKKVI